LSRRRGGIPRRKERVVSHGKHAAEKQRPIFGSGGKKGGISKGKRKGTATRSFNAFSKRGGKTARRVTETKRGGGSKKKARP